MELDLAAFVDPPWTAPLDADAVLAAIPADATMNGLFLTAIAELAAAKGVTLPSARPRYIAFRPYPLREHGALLVEAARALYPKGSLREGLRHLGRGAPAVLVRSTLGRVVLGSVEGPLEIMRAMAKSYPLQTQPGTLEVIAPEPGCCVVELREIYTFVDSHHVGVFEGALRFAGVEGSVRLRSRSASAADLFCDWRR